MSNKREQLPVTLEVSDINEIKQLLKRAREEALGLGDAGDSAYSRAAYSRFHQTLDKIEEVIAHRASLDFTHHPD